MELKDIQKNKIKKASLQNEIKKIYIDQIEQGASSLQNLNNMFKPITDVVREAKTNVQNALVGNTNDLKALVGTTTDLRSLIEEKQSKTMELVPYSEEIKQKQSKLAELELLPANYDQLGDIAKEFLQDRKDSSFGLSAVTDPQTGVVEFYFGNQIVHFDNNDLYLNGNFYKGTPGLWELITRKEPEHKIVTAGSGEFKRDFKFVEPDDVNTYLKMVDTSSIHMTSRNKLRSNKGFKYTEFIGPWFAKKYRKPIHINTPVRPRNLADVTFRNRKIKRTKSESTSFSGDGIEFISRDPIKLEHQLHLLLGNLQLGHTNVDFNKMNVIADELYGLGRLTKKEYQSILLRKFGSKTFK